MNPDRILIDKHAVCERRDRWEIEVVRTLPCYHDIMINKTDRSEQGFIKLEKTRKKIIETSS